MYVRDGMEKEEKGGKGRGREGREERESKGEERKEWDTLCSKPVCTDLMGGIEIGNRIMVLIRTW